MSHHEKAIETLEELCESTSDDVRVQAAQALLWAEEYGKPTPHEEAPSLRRLVETMDDADLAELGSFIEREKLVRRARA